MATLNQAKGKRQHKFEAEARSQIGRILRMARSLVTPKQQAEDVPQAQKKGALLNGKS